VEDDDTLQRVRRVARIKSARRIIPPPSVMRRCGGGAMMPAEHGEGAAERGRRRGAAGRGRERRQSLRPHPLRPPWSVRVLARRMASLCPCGLAFVKTVGAPS
jgi:hypothetical protein